MSRERPGQKQICLFSMAGNEPRWCAQSECEAWAQRNEECSLVSSLNSIAYNLYRLAQFKSYELKLSDVKKVAGKGLSTRKRKSETGRGSSGSETQGAGGDDR